MKPNIIVRVLLTLACVCDFRNRDKAHEISYGSYIPFSELSDHSQWTIRARPLTANEQALRDAVVDSLMVL